jgi:DNA mismatch repair protein MutL
VSQEAVVAPQGSTFKVRNLFFNGPARRKFIEDSEKEAAKIKTEFRRVALCHPEVGFALYKDDAPLYNLPISSLKGRIAGLMGKAVAANLLEVSTSTSLVKVEGFVCRPEVAKKRGADQYLFINGRYFKSPYLHKAVVMAYDKLIPAGVQPSYFLYLTVDADRVDVNVHPQKTEVKFSDEGAIWQILNAAVRESLAKTGVIPMMDFEDEGEVEIPVFNSNRSGGLQEPSTTTNPFYNPFQSEPRVGGGSGSVGVSSGSRSSVLVGGGLHDMESGFNAPYPKGVESEEEREYDSSIIEFIEGGGDTSAQGELELEIESQGFVGALPLAGGYVATSIGGRLAVVNVARASEVVRYRHYMAMLSEGNSLGQTLLFPERLVLSADDVELLGENYDNFVAFGFDYTIQDANTVEFSTLPADVSLEELEEVVYDMIDSFKDNSGLSQQRRRESAARLLARTRTHKRLSQTELEALLADLNGCADCSLTPDGRAVVKLFGEGEMKEML